MTNFAVFTGDKTSNAKVHYNGGIPVNHSSESDLELYYKMDENGGTTVTDSSGNGNNGTFDGDQPTWIKAMDVTNTYHKGKQVKADMSKNERG